MKFLSLLVPHEASTVAPQVDNVVWGLLAFSGFILILIFGLITGFGIYYRQGSPHPRIIRKGGQTLLEWGWTFATLFIFMVFFVWGSIGYVQMHVPPAGASEITVVGKQWMWKFQHPNGVRELDELHVPVGQPIVLVMTSQDVIHSLFVPEFRIKQDVLPGRYSRLWFQATRPGAYHIFCTQYCGTMHAGMRGKVIVMERQDYERWMQTGIASAGLGAQSMAARGRDLFTKLGCISCHGMNPGQMAPALGGIFGKPVGLSDGRTVIADEDYIRESILNPKAKIVQGYQAIMPSFAGVVGEEDVLGLIAYIKSLGVTPQSQSPGGHP